jgi:DNA/RNA endonuclease YhcR with UshA esterase domain
MLFVKHSRTLTAALLLVLIFLLLVLGGCGYAGSTKDMVTSAAIGVTTTTQHASTSSSRLATTSTTLKPSTTATTSQKSTAIPWDQASDYVGDRITVEGPVVSTKYANSSNGSPTFLNMGRDYPNTSRLTVLIWGGSRDNFSGAPESLYAGKTIRVKGSVSMYNGAAQIEVSDPSQITVVK